MPGTLICICSSHSIAPITLTIIITLISQVGIHQKSQNTRVPETVSLNQGLHDSSLPHQDAMWADGIKQQIQDKQKAICPHNGISLAIKKNEVLTRAMERMNLDNVMLNERS